LLSLRVTLTNFINPVYIGETQRLALLTYLATLGSMTIDIDSLQNRLLKVCYVPATSASLPRVSFFFSFLFLLLPPLTALMNQTRQAVCAVKQYILLDVYEHDTDRIVSIGQGK
jgi:hypothetical protein